MDETSSEKKPAPQPARAASRSGRRWLKRIFTYGFVLLALAMLVYAWLPKPVLVEVASVKKGQLVVTVDEDGRTRVKDRYVVSAPLTGNLARIGLRAGDAVKQGQVLARLVPLSAPLLDVRSREQAEARVQASFAATRQAKAQIARAKAALEFARKEAERSRDLVAGEVIGEGALDQAVLDTRSREAELTSAEFGSKVANYELKMAQAALGQFKAGSRGQQEEQFEVPSPVNGRVLRVIQESEGVVQAGAPLLELGDPKALEIVVDVLTGDAVNIEPGSPVSVEQWGGEPLKGHVRLVEPSAFTRVSALGVEEQRVNAVIDLAAPYEKWAQLGDGYRVETRIEVQRIKDAMKAPASALFRRDQRWAAFVVEGDTARLRKLEVGGRNDREVSVTKGLEPGERVIVHPSDRVNDGVKVVTR